MKLFSKKEVVDESLEEGDANLDFGGAVEDGPIFTSLRHLLRVGI